MNRYFSARMIAGITGAFAALMVAVLASFADAQTCSFTTSPAVVQAGHAGGTFTVSFTASDSACNWVVGSSEDWITVTSATRGTGSGTFTISVNPNTGNAARQGRITFRRQYVWVDQQAEVCTYTLTRSQYTLPHHNPFTLGLGVKTNKTSCAWSIEETADWISVAPSSPKSGSGDGNFSLMFTQNTSSASRTANVRIGDATLTITQPGLNAGCTYTLTQLNRTLPHHLSYTLGLTVKTSKPSCTWSIEETADWIALAPSSTKSGMGNGSFTLNFSQNTSSEARTAQVKIGDQTLTFTQPGMNAGCTYTLTQLNRTLPHHLSYTLGLTVKTSKPSCTWSIEETADWITLAPSSPKSGMGNGSFTLNFSQNTSSEARTAQVKIGDQTLTVTQPGMNAGCTYTLTQLNRTLPHHLPYTLASTIKTNKTSCAWTIEETADWIALAPSSPKSGMGNGSFTLNFSQNTSGAARTAQVKIGDQTLTFTQPAQTSAGTGAAATGCSFNLSKTSHNAGAGNVRGSFSVKAGSGCNWTATTNTGWISIVSGSSGSGNGAVKFTVEANNNQAERTGHISVAGQTFSVIQKGLKASAKDRRHI